MSDEHGKPTRETIRRAERDGLADLSVNTSRRPAGSPAGGPPDGRSEGKPAAGTPGGEPMKDQQAPQRRG
ncbi:hypothetical protein MMB17_16485 [Methylobacterium organophilum]|uniref:hypothetical protein n=1 Tax=Methylobacterium organophilum TaxID=410 RepID=UPI001F1378DD|nr:hypothetical protein [Methylobacterium organophilum]UMY16307.1 hypothetical protein MMB17_16485 [Methylobacterium organophilum]